MGGFSFTSFTVKLEDPPIELTYGSLIQSTTSFKKSVLVSSCFFFGILVESGLHIRGDVLSKLLP